MSSALGQALSPLNKHGVGRTGVTNSTSQRRKEMPRKDTSQGHSKLGDLESWSPDSEVLGSPRVGPEETSPTQLFAELTV